MCFKVIINNVKLDVVCLYWYLVCFVMRYRLELYKNIQIYVIDELRYLMLKNCIIDINFFQKIVLLLVIFYMYVFLLFIYFILKKILIFLKIVSVIIEINIDNIFIKDFNILVDYC